MINRNDIPFPSDDELTTELMTSLRDLATYFATELITYTSDSMLDETTCIAELISQLTAILYSLDQTTDTIADAFDEMIADSTILDNLDFTYALPDLPIRRYFNFD